MNFYSVIALFICSSDLQIWTCGSDHQEVEGPITLYSPVSRGGDEGLLKAIKGLETGKSGYKSPGNSPKHKGENPFK